MYGAGMRSWAIFCLAICTTLCLQILSNLCNELGDAQKGTDADQHGREAYGLQAGTLTIAAMKRMIGGFFALSVVFGSALVGTAFLGQPSGIYPILIFLALGLAAIIGAMTYTLGKHSYGYRGLGDLSVFLFFGLLSTCGGYYLLTRTLSWEVVACGAAIGLPCVGVLNLNNLRDMPNDRKHGKRTFAGMLGQTAGRKYHTFLLVGCLAIFTLYGHYWTLCITPIWAWHLYKVLSYDAAQSREGYGLDKQMPVLMFSTLIVAILALF